MGLQTATIKTGATWAPTGGTDLSFVPDGKALTDGVNLVVVADTNLLLRRSLTARATLPAAPTKVGNYAKLGRNSIVYKLPMVALDGKTYVQSVRIEVTFHAEYSLANKTIAIQDACALTADSDFQNFWLSSILT